MPIKSIQPPKITAPSVASTVEADPAVARSREGLDGVTIIGADLTDLRLGSASWVESVLTSVTMANTQLAGCRFFDVRLERVDAIDVDAHGTAWRDSEVVASRLGAWTLYDSAVDSLRVVGTKLGFVNMRGSVINDIAFEDCSIEELDLSDATLTRASFRGCSIGTLTIRNATLRHVDLRGAHLGGVEPVGNLRGGVIDSSQLAELAPTLAEGVGLIIE